METGFGAEKFLHCVKSGRMTKLSHLLTAIFALTAVCKLSAQD